MAWTSSDEDEQPQPEPRRAGSPTKWWEAPAPYAAPPPPWVQDAETFKRRRPRPDAGKETLKYIGDDFIHGREVSPPVMVAKMIGDRHALGLAGCQDLVFWGRISANE